MGVKFYVFSISVHLQLNMRKQCSMFFAEQFCKTGRMQTDRLAIMKTLANNFAHACFSMAVLAL